MKKYIKKAAFLIFPLVIMASCSGSQQDIFPVFSKGIELSLTGRTETLILTKSMVELPSSTPIGVYALETAPGSVTLSDTPFRNALYSAIGTDGAFTSLSPIILQDSQSYKTCAYAPYAKSLADAAHIPFTHGTDVLYAPFETVNITTPSSGISVASVALTFSHKMSRIQFTLISGSGNPDLAGATLHVTGFCESCTMNLADGSITPITGAGASIDEPGKAVCFVPVSSGVVLNVKVTTSDNHTYTGTISRVFEAGNSYSYSLTLDKNNPKLGITGHVVDWIAINGGNVSVTE